MVGYLVLALLHAVLLPRDGANLDREEPGPWLYAAFVASVLVVAALRTRKTLRARRMAA